MRIRPIARLGFMLMWTSTPPIAGRALFRLAPGSQVPWGVVQPFQSQLNISQAAPGTYQIAVAVDPDNRVGETNETNNSTTCTLTVGP
jgi:hypothetical protein